MKSPIITVRDVVNRFGSQVVHDGVRSTAALGDRGKATVDHSSAQVVRPATRPSSIDLRSGGMGLLATSSCDP